MAGDNEASDEVARIRASAATKMKIGIPLVIAGLVVAAVFDRVNSSNPDSNVGRIGYVGGALVSGVGGLLWYSATRR